MDSSIAHPIQIAIFLAMSKRTVMHPKKPLRLRRTFSTFALNWHIPNFVITVLILLFNASGPAYASTPLHRCNLLLGNGIGAVGARCPDAYNQFLDIYFLGDHTFNCSLTYPNTTPCTFTYTSGIFNGQTHGILARWDYICADGSSPEGNVDYPQTLTCPSTPPPPDPTTCQTCPCPAQQDGPSTPHPIVPATAEKLRIETDISLPGPHPLAFNRTYRSGRVGGASASFGPFRAAASSTTNNTGSASSSVSEGFRVPSFHLMGQGWSSSQHAQMYVAPSLVASVGGQGSAPYWLGWVTLSLGDGRYRIFKPTSNGYQPLGGGKDKLWTTTNGNDSSATQYIYQAFDSDDRYVFGFAANEPIDPLMGYHGHLQHIQHRNGWMTQYTLDSSAPPGKPRPSKVTNTFGHSLAMSYTANGQLSQVRQLSPSGAQVAAVNYAYDSGLRLTQVNHSDGSTRSLHYENPANPHWLTGYSLNGQRVDTYSYDNQGRAIESTRAAYAERYRVDYSQSVEDTTTGTYNQATVIDPLGTARNYGYSAGAQRLNAISASAPPNDEGVKPVATRSVDTNGQITGETSFSGNSNSTTYDPTRQLPTTINEGNGARAQTITWHPTFRLPTQIDETGGKRTVFVYDNNGNLLQKTITSTAGTASTAVNEVWSWTYNAQGLVSSETDPRGAVTTYAHNAQGQLTAKTNALGHATTYAYNPAGRVSQINEPTGLIRRLTYTPRGWLATSTHSVGNVHLATAYTYTVDGQIKTAALPNGHTLTYHYDAALRNTGWSDNRGQSAVYTLDPAGNATEEQTRNSGGQLALHIRRTISALNRVQSETLGNGITQTFTQDPNGRTASATDALGMTTTLGRDALGRVNRVTAASGNFATLTHNAQDAVTQVVDFKYVQTNFTRDVQGSARLEATPDAGTTATTTDALGLPSRIVDALGRASDITRDALGRPTLITHSPAPGTPAAAPGGKVLTTQLRYDLTGTACNASGQANASKGRLCEVIDKVNGPNGPMTHATTQYQWDAFGRLTRQTQTLSSAIASHSTIRTTTLAYRTSGGGKGDLATLTYPSGAVLTHQYNATGRLTGMLWAGRPLLQNIVYNALDQPMSWTWAFADTNAATSLSATRLYNTAGQLTSAEFATFAPETTGRIGSVSQKLVRANGSGGWVSEDVSFNALYNALGQLTSFQALGAAPVFQWGHTYSYDANANRTGGTITANGASMSFTSGVQYGTNRLSDAAGITVTTNAAGDITALLGKTLAYDAAGRLAEASAVPPCPSGQNCSGAVTTLSRFNGWGQRFLRETPTAQTVFSYGSDGHNLLSETTRQVTPSGQTTTLNTTEHIYLPTASGPMPVAAVINGVHYAVHSDHLNTPRRLSDANKAVRWQWPYSGFGEIAPQATPATGQAPLSYALRYPGQVDDGNGLFYNWNRFYDARVGRYTSSDPIGLEGGWNRFGYVGGNPLSFVDPEGLQPNRPQWWNDMWKPITPPGSCATPECAAGLSNSPGDSRPQSEIDNSICKTICTLVAPIDILPDLSWKGVAKWAGQNLGATISCKLYCDNKCPK